MLGNNLSTLCHELKQLSAECVHLKEKYKMKQQDDMNRVRACVCMCVCARVCVCVYVCEVRGSSSYVVFVLPIVTHS